MAPYVNLTIKGFVEVRNLDWDVANKTVSYRNLPASFKRKLENDIAYRIRNFEGIDLDDIELDPDIGYLDDEDMEEFEAYVDEYLNAQLDSRKLVITSVEFSEYVETETMRADEAEYYISNPDYDDYIGYDYTAYTDIDLVALYYEYSRV